MRSCRKFHCHKTRDCIAFYYKEIKRKIPCLAELADAQLVRSDVALQKISARKNSSAMTGPAES